MCDLYLFVDDIRTATAPWINARTVVEAQALIANAVTFEVSLDHDLGGDSTSRELINWMLRNGHCPSAAAVHSANPVGRHWLEMALERDFGHPIPALTNPPVWE